MEAHSVFWYTLVLKLAKPVKMICSMVGESCETKSQQSVVSIRSNYIWQTRAAVLVAKNEQLSSTTCVLETNHALGKTLISLFMPFINNVCSGNQSCFGEDFDKSVYAFSH